MDSRQFKELIPYLIIIIVVILVKSFIVTPIRVNGASMYYTLHDKDIMLLNKTKYKLKKIERFDIVVVYIKETNKYLVKRVIALPNETVSYKDSQLYINDVAIEEDFLDEDYVSSQSMTREFTGDLEVTLAEDEYFLLGDNRPYSKDSRSYGAFSKEDIISKGLFVLFPFNEFGVK